MKRNTLNSAEKIVYKYIKSFFDTRQAIRLHQYPIFDISGNTRYEPDNLLIDINLGVINIEVKGLTITNIESIEGNNWYCKDFYSENIAPYKQAEMQIDIFCKRLKEEGIIKKDITKRIFIALPFIESSEWKRKGLDSICAPTILFKDDFQNGKWIEKLQKGILHHATPDIDEEDYKCIKSTIIQSRKEEVEEASVPFSKLWILNEKSNVSDIKKTILHDVNEGIKTFIISTSNIISSLSLPKEEAYIKNGVINLHPHDTKNWNEELIINGEGISESLSDELEGVMSFNYRQFQAIHHPYHSSVAIQASAGTGKTYLLVDRVMYLLISSPATIEDIIIITFTNAATNEMRGRIIKRLEGLFDLTKNIKFLHILENIDSLKISTIHAFAKSVIMQYADNIGINRNVKVTGMKQEKRKIIEELVDSFIKDTKNYDIKDMLGFTYYKVVDFILDIMEEIEKKAIGYEDVKNIKWGIDETILGDIISYVIPRMDAILAIKKLEEDKLETNDLIRMLGNIDDLQPNDSKMRFLFVDEFQDSDIGQIQFFTKLMNRMEYRLFVIGDIKQSIYRFRGADHTAYDQLKEASEQKLTSLSLINNYRSSKRLIKDYNRLFTTLAERELLSYGENDLVRGQEEIETKVNTLNVIKLDKSEKAKDETIKLVRYIRDASPNEQIAILVRSNRDIVTVREWFNETGLILKENIDGDFFMSGVVMDFRCLLVGLMFYNDSRSLYDAYMSPYFAYKFNSIDLKELDGDELKIIDYINTKTDNALKEYVKLLSQEPLLTVVNRIVRDRQLYDNLYTHLREVFPDEDEKILRNQVTNYANNLHHLFKLIINTFNTEVKSLPQILSWLDMKIKTDRKENSIRSDGKDYDIELMTVHKSKGLEFDYVILPIMNKSFSHRESDVIMNPGTMTLSWKMDKKISSRNYDTMYEEEMGEVKKEETRLLYVAMTRAIRSITLMMPKKPKENTWAKLLEGSLEE